MKTEVVVGRDIYKKDRTEVLEQQFAVLKKEEKTLSREMNGVMAKTKNVLDLPKSVRRKLLEKVKRLRQVRKVHGDYLEEIEKLHERDEIDLSAKVIVHKKLYQGTVVEIGKLKQIIHRDVTGPVELVANENFGTVEIRPIKK